MQMEFFLGADADLPIRKAINILNSSRCIADYPEIEGSFATLGSSRDDADAWCESGERIYALRCHSDVMHQDEAYKALCYALFEGGGLNPDLHVDSIE